MVVFTSEKDLSLKKVNSLDKSLSILFKLQVLAVELQ